MLTLALCQDSNKAFVERKHSFDPHMAHLKTVMGDIRFAAPLATADGAAVSGDERLKASVMVFELPAARTREVMAADPYFTNGVWESIQLFEFEGAGSVPTASPGAFPSLYAVFSTGSPKVRHPKDLSASPVLEGRLTPASSLGPATTDSDWKYACVIAGASLDAVKTVLNADPAGSKAGARVIAWAIPLSVGSWVKPKNAG